MTLPTLDYASPKPFWSKSVTASLAIGVPLAALAAIFGPSALDAMSTHAYATGGPDPHSTLPILREVIARYTADHGKPPAEGVLNTQLNHATNKTGVSTSGPATTDYPYGPYVQCFPTNGLNGSAKVGDRPIPGVGWVYIVEGTDWSIQMANARGDGVEENYRY